MKTVTQTDISFPSWLTLSGAWELTLDDPDVTRTIIGHNLSRLREARGFSRQRLAAEVQTSVRALREIETGRVLPEFALLWRLAQVFGVDCVDFLSGAREA